MPEKDNPVENYTFPQKVWQTGGIFALIVVILLLLNETFSVFILILAGALIAIFFRGISDFIKRKTNCNATLALCISIFGSILIIVLLFLLIGSKVQVQIKELGNALPITIENAKQQLNKSSLAQKIVNNLTSPKAQEEAKKVAATFLKSTFGVLGDVYVILFLAVFFTAAPQIYEKGILQLVPKKGKEKAEYILFKIGNSLKNWLEGKFFAMLVVFVLTALGLFIMGVPMWLALALIAGLLNFIPNFGPLIAMIPAVLVALMQGPTTAGMVAGLYILIQVTESNFITPLVQQKLINIPPALIIIAQLLVGTLTGAWGVILATPLMVIILVLVQELYVKKINKE